MHKSVSRKPFLFAPFGSLILILTTHIHFRGFDIYSVSLALILRNELATSKVVAAHGAQ